MSENYVIEIQPPGAGRTVQAGIVVRDGRGYAFFDAAADFNALEAQRFKTPKAAEQAARRRVADLRLHGAPPAAGFADRKANADAYCPDTAGANFD